MHKSGTVKAKGLDRAKLEAIQQMPNDQGLIELAEYLHQGVMGEKRSSKPVHYVYGPWGHTGELISELRRRITDPNALAMIPGAAKMKDIVADGKKETMFSQQRKMRSATQQTYGEFDLNVEWDEWDGESRETNVVSFTFAYKPTVEQVRNKEKKVTEKNYVTKAYNFSHGQRLVDPSNRLEYAWLRLHPMNLHSLVRTPEKCEAVGFRVSSDPQMTNRNAHFKDAGHSSAIDAKIQASAAEIKLISMLETSDTPTLRSWVKACDLSINTASEAPIRDQFAAALRQLIEGRDPAAAAVRNRLRLLMEGDPDRIGSVMEDAFKAGIIEVDDQSDVYFNDGDKRDLWDDILIHSNRKGEEIDVIVEYFMTTRTKAADLRIARVEGALGEVLKKSREADKVYEMHDRLMDDCLLKEVIKKDNKASEWVVVTADGGTEKLCKMPKAKHEDQLAALRAWARGMTYDKLQGKLAIMFSE